MTAIGARSGTLANLAYARISNAITIGVLKPGQRVRFEDLRELCQTSISPVREALTRLTAEGLTTLEGHRGYRVAPLSRDDLWDTVRTRQLVEGRAVRQAVAEGGEAWEAALVSAYHLMSRWRHAHGAEPSAGTEDWHRHHVRFHQALIAGCGSPLLLGFCETLAQRAERYRRLSLGAPYDRDIHREHADIYEAALRRDAAEAEARLCFHYEQTARALEAAIAGEQAAPWEERPETPQGGAAADT